MSKCDKCKLVQLLEKENAYMKSLVDKFCISMGINPVNHDNLTLADDIANLVKKTEQPDPFSTLNEVVGG